MYAIEFQAKIQDGKIEIPIEKRRQLLSHIETGFVRVIVLTAEEDVADVAPTSTTLVQDAKNKGYDNFIEYLLANPIQAPNFKPLTRDEIYDRTNI
jgi:hypothetical protein